MRPACQVFWARQLAGKDCALWLRGEPLFSSAGCLRAGLVFWQSCKFLCVRAGWHAFWLRPDDSLVARWTGGMRGARGVKFAARGSCRSMSAACILLWRLAHAYVCCSAALQSCVRFSCTFSCFMVACACACLAVQKWWQWCLSQCSRGGLPAREMWCRML